MNPRLIALQEARRRVPVSYWRKIRGQNVGFEGTPGKGKMVAGNPRVMGGGKKKSSSGGSGGGGGEGRTSGGSNPAVSAAQKKIDKINDRLDDLNNDWVVASKGERKRIDQAMGDLMANREKLQRTIKAAKATPAQKAKAEQASKAQDARDKEQAARLRKQVAAQRKDIKSQDGIVPPSARRKLEQDAAELSRLEQRRAAYKRTKALKGTSGKGGASVAKKKIDKINDELDDLNNDWVVASKGERKRIDKRMETLMDQRAALQKVAGTKKKAAPKADKPKADPLSDRQVPRKVTEPKKQKNYSGIGKKLTGRAREQEFPTSSRKTRLSDKERAQARQLRDIDRQASAHIDMAQRRLRADARLSSRSRKKMKGPERTGVEAGLKAAMRQRDQAQADMAKLYGTKGTRNFQRDIHGGKKMSPKVKAASDKAAKDFKSRIQKSDTTKARVDKLRDAAISRARKRGEDAAAIDKQVLQKAGGARGSMSVKDLIRSGASGPEFQAASRRTYKLAKQFDRAPDSVAAAKILPRLQKSMKAERDALIRAADRERGPKPKDAKLVRQWNKKRREDIESANELTGPRQVALRTPSRRAEFSAATGHKMPGSGGRPFKTINDRSKKLASDHASQRVIQDPSKRSKRRPSAKEQAVRKANIEARKKAQKEANAKRDRDVARWRREQYADKERDAWDKKFRPKEYAKRKKAEAEAASKRATSKKAASKKAASGGKDRKYYQDKISKLDAREKEKMRQQSFFAKSGDNRRRKAAEEEIRRIDMLRTSYQKSMASLGSKRATRKKD